MYSDASMPWTLSSSGLPGFVCQIGKLKPRFRLVEEEEDSTTFRDNQHKFQMTAAARQKEESQAPPPSLRLCCSPLILLIAPQVKICCSHQFDSISDDAATRSLFSSCSSCSSTLHPPSPPSPLPPLLFTSSLPLLVSRIELSCSSNRQHRESLVHLGSLTDGCFTPII